MVHCINLDRKENVRTKNTCTHVRKTQSLNGDCVLYSITVRRVLAFTRLMIMICQNILTQLIRSVQVFKRDMRSLTELLIEQPDQVFLLSKYDHKCNYLGITQTKYESHVYQNGLTL
jgi:hypothetical protein